MIDLGSSDAPVVMGCSPFKTPWRLWAEKTGLIEVDSTPSEIMEWGTILEPVVLTSLVNDLGATIANASPHTTRWHTDRPWARATPDAIILVNNVPALVEVKCCITQPPSVPRVEWLIQALHQRMVYPEAERLYIVAFGGLRKEWWLIPKHQKAMDRVLREEEKFLELVEKQIPPPVRAADASVLAKAWPITKAEPIKLSKELEERDEYVQKAARMVREWEQVKDTNEAMIKAAMGDHEEALLPDGTRYTWKWHERKGFTVEPSRARRFKRVGGKENGE